MRDERLRADCGRCLGLCCVVPAFAASADFAIDKPAGRPCPNLRPDHGCGIHDTLRERGFPGCTVYDCFGAGQHVVQVVFAGATRREPAMGPVFEVVRVLHELRHHLTEALTWDAAAPVRDELAGALARSEALSTGTPAELAALDVAGHRAAVAALLRRASVLVRADRPGTDRSEAARARARPGSGAMLLGADLQAADLRGTDLSSALLLGADLRRADLRGADLLGADLRAADLSGADLTGALYCVQAQLDAARGDASTTVPAGLTRPAHWTPRPPARRRPPRAR